MQFHNPKDLATAISIEAAELLQLFLWKNSEEITDCAREKRRQIEEEVADIAIYLLELADKLDLSADQRSKVQELFDSMKQEALPLGAKLLDQESKLDREFVNHTITPESLKSATAAIAATQGALRETHLKYHLSTVAILTQNQLQRYSELRGYGDHVMRPGHHQN